MRLAFLGTPEAAVPPLHALLEAGHDIEVVVTRPDRRRGRGSTLSPSPVKAAALEHGLTVVHRLAELAAFDLERGIVVAYGAIIPAPLLERIPMLNVHFSLLPRWRGAAPVERALLAGDEVTGVSIMTLEPSLDTGPVHLERRIEIDEKTAAQLRGELATLGAQALVEVLASPELLAHPTPQAGEATYAEKLTKETFHLEPTMSVALASRTVRLGGAFFFAGGKRIAVVRAATYEGSQEPGVIVANELGVVLSVSDGGLLLEEVRPEGASTMDAQSWWRGLRREDLSWN
ncbi:MAG TPA: methionyl-tRNA formyltransferase [Acidimicrobiales bacterium]|nr:methionyl-tRNA formyltransferase [Acidimicrobiales bacterium]